MRKLISFLTAVLLVFTVIGPAPAEEAEAAPACTCGDFEYRVNEDGTAVIVKYTGTGKAALSLPSELDGHPVVSVGEGAFRELTDLTGVAIPDGITSIG